MYFTSPDIAGAFHHLGFPDYFRVELAIAKFLGVIALVAPIPARIKEWAYFGFFATFVSAFVAHFISGDPASAIISPIVATLLLSISYIAYHRIHKSNVVTA